MITIRDTKIFIALLISYILFIISILYPALFVTALIFWSIVWIYYGVLTINKN